MKDSADPGDSVGTKEWFSHAGVTEEFYTFELMGKVQDYPAFFWET
jgi:hypothetical protein